MITTYIIKAMWMCCVSLITDLIMETATEWVTAMERVQHGSCWTKGWVTSRWDTAVQHEIPSCYSEWHTIQNLLIVYFWYFPFNVFRLQLIEGNWNHRKGNRREGRGGVTVRNPFCLPRALGETTTTQRFQWSYWKVIYGRGKVRMPNRGDSLVSR